jgi:hypothetical protein
MSAQHTALPQGAHCQHGQAPRPHGFRGGKRFEGLRQRKLKLENYSFPYLWPFSQGLHIAFFFLV